MLHGDIMEIDGDVYIYTHTYSQHYDILLLVDDKAWLTL